MFFTQVACARVHFRFTLYNNIDYDTTDIDEGLH